jgi:predicted GNAT superfamily acetyltransferase
MKPEISIRPLSDIEEFRCCVDLQRQIWGFDDLDIMPLRFYVIAAHTGGQVFGAFTDENRMVGFLTALSGMKDRMPYLHSHQLGVLSEYREIGIARRLKLAQRDDAVGRGYQLIEWTFDPLELKNAYFNIEKLGAIVRRYSVNQYGLTSSRLQAGLPTDRMFAEWWIQSDRVKRCLGEIAAVPEMVGEEDLVKVEVPSSVLSWKTNDPLRACALQGELREKFLKCFSRSLAVTRFQRCGENSVYVLTKHFNC